MTIAIYDWIIIGLYLVGMLYLSYWLSKGQEDEKDYYLGGNDTGVWPIAISTMATQCSTNSILGAPAFVAFTASGGLLWLQYELAVPLAMIILMAFVLPVYRKLGLISVYGYLEDRFGLKTRLTLSVLFQVLKALATGVTVYGISLVIQSITGLSFFFAVIILGTVTIVYDSIGGMKAVIYSDVIQMVILVGNIIVTIFIALSILGGWSELVTHFDPSRWQAIDFSHHGFDGHDFSFWPMLIGGFFLYLSYYGCDQSQVQRELSTKSVKDTNRSLYINGLLRFPLVLLYVFLGVCIGAFAHKFPDFIEMLPKTPKGAPNYNVAVPAFVVKHFPVGVVGLFIVGLFSAAMSSLDSVINSLSAATMQDIIIRFRKTDLSDRQQLLASKGLTVFWGSLCIFFAFFVGNISDSIVVSINKIGSVSNGPILAVFALGIFTKRANELGALIGFGAGMLFNIILWIFFPDVSWLWWNALGFFVSFGLGLLFSFGASKYSPSKNDTNEGNESEAKSYIILSAYFIGIVLSLLLISRAFA